MNLTILVDRYILKSFLDSVALGLIIKTGRNLSLSSRFLFSAFTPSSTLSVNSSSPCIAKPLHFLPLRLLEAGSFQSRRKLGGLVRRYCTRVRRAVPANALLQATAVISAQLEETAIGEAQCIASSWTYPPRRTAWSMQCAIQAQHRPVNSGTVLKLLILSRIVIHCQYTVVQLDLRDVDEWRRIPYVQQCGGLWTLLQMKARRCSLQFWLTTTIQSK